MDALLSTVMMPSGIPVATVAIDGGKNAALLAAEILAVSDPELAEALDERRSAEAEAVREKDANIENRL
jgi:5-(carboxyamino)imidazole ribonucleotide mutase